MSVIFETERLMLRNWKKEDTTPFTEMCRDPDVMKYISKLHTPEETRMTIRSILDHFRKYDFGLYALEKKESGSFIGFTGFMIPNFEHYFTPCIEIGWRIKSTEWNKGYATEAAIACLKYGFNNLSFKKIHSFTSVHNKASERVMQKTGLKNIGSFFHPMLPPDHFLSEHVLYCIENNDSW
jgi:RimJ/RimL family protein N-acetyltransferase